MTSRQISSNSGRRRLESRRENAIEHLIAIAAACRMRLYMRTAPPCDSGKGQ